MPGLGVCRIDGVFVDGIGSLVGFGDAACHHGMKGTAALMIPSVVVIGEHVINALLPRLPEARASKEDARGFRREARSGRQFVT